MLSGRTWMIVGVVGAVLVRGASGAGLAGDFELGPRYVDPVNGFSLRPPARAERSREFSLSRLVRWSVRDKKTAAIAWTVTVGKEPGPKDGAAPEAHVKQIVDALGKRGDVKVDSFAPLELAGKKAFYLRTQRGRKTRRWQGEIWIHTDADRFLTLAVNGPLGEADALESALREIASTLRLTDPASLAAARKEGLQRGAALLKTIVTGKLAAAVDRQPRWYLYRRGGKDIGFLHAAEKLGGPGLTVRTFARLTLQGGQVLHLRREMSCSADRGTERWAESVVVRKDGKTVRQMSETGSKRGLAIECKVTADGKTATRNKPVPAVTNAHYLPRAMALLLGRLVDRAQPSAYAFATYTTAANDFDMRTFTVIGPQQVTLGARTVQAVRASDQVAADAEAAALHLDAAGRVLRMRTDTGIVMEQSTRSAVLRRFPDAETLVRGK